VINSQNRHCQVRAESVMSLACHGGGWPRHPQQTGRGIFLVRSVALVVSKRRRRRCSPSPASPRLCPITAEAGAAEPFHYRGKHWWQPTPSHPAWATKAWFGLPLSTKLWSIIGQGVAVSIALSQLKGRCIRDDSETEEEIEYSRFKSRRIGFVACLPTSKQRPDSVSHS
jgi:hypothetical protein